MLVSKNKKEFYIREAKQVGKLYHVCTLEDVAKYIAPRDVLSPGGSYNNWLLGGRTDVISFTRDKSFVVSTKKINNAIVLFDFEIDGDLVSNNKKVVPYNDFAYNSNGTFNSSSAFENPDELEHEEVVVGQLKPFSSFVTSVRFSVNIQRKLSYIIFDVNKYLEDVSTYLSKFDKIEYDFKLYSDDAKLSNIIHYPSFNAFVESFSIIERIVGGEVVSISDIKKAFKYFPDHVLDSLLWLEVDSSIRNTPLIRALILMGADSSEYKSGNVLDGLKSLLEYGVYLPDEEKLRKIIPILEWGILDSYIPVERFEKAYIEDLVKDELSYMKDRDILSSFNDIKLTPEEKEKMVSILSPYVGKAIGNTRVQVSDLKNPIDYSKLAGCLWKLNSPYFETLLNKYSRDIASMDYQNKLKNNDIDGIIYYVTGDLDGEELYKILYKEVLPKDELDSILLSLFKV